MIINVEPVTEAVHGACLYIWGYCHVVVADKHEAVGYAGVVVTTIHFINCSDVYEGLLMKGGLDGLELENHSASEQASVELLTFNGHERPLVIAGLFVLCLIVLRHAKVHLRGGKLTDK